MLYNHRASYHASSTLMTDKCLRKHQQSPKSSQNQPSSMGSQLSWSSQIPTAQTSTSLSRVQKSRSETPKTAPSRTSPPSESVSQKHWIFRPLDTATATSQTWPAIAHIPATWAWTQKTWSYRQPFTTQSGTLMPCRSCCQSQCLTTISKTQTSRWHLRGPFSSKTNVVSTPFHLTTNNESVHTTHLHIGPFANLNNVRIRISKASLASLPSIPQSDPDVM